MWRLQQSFLHAPPFCRVLNFSCSWEGNGRKMQTLGRELVTAPFLGQKFFLKLKDNVFFLSLFHFLFAVNVK